MFRSFTLKSISSLALLILALPVLMGLGCPANPPVPGQTGACCAANGTCTVTAQADCSTGTWTAGATCSPNPCTPAPTPVTPQLFISNFVGKNITSYLNPSSVNGNQPPNTNIAGAQTNINNPADIVVTASGVLLVANRLPAPTAAVLSFPGAATANGNVVPARNVQGAQTGLNLPTTLAISGANDLVFVANNTGAGSAINVYAGASTASFLGNLAPTRTITSAALNNPFGINFGANDELYVANSADNKVLVFNNASNRNGTIAPDRTLTNAAFAGIFDVFVDTSDRLYVVNGAGGGANANRIHVVNNASTKNGAVNIDSTLVVTGAASLTAVAVDKNGTGYVVDSTGGGTGAVFAYDAIATKNGAFAPDRSITGAATQLSGPIRVFLVE